MASDPLLTAFERRLARNPLAPLALARRRRATIQDVDAHARAALAQLEGAALAPGAVVGLCAANGPAFLAAFLALRRARMAALLLDPSAPLSLLDQATAALGGRCILSCDGAWPRDANDWTLRVVAEPPARDEEACLPGVAVVKLTSGSVGKPRGVAVTSEQLAADEAQLTSSMGLADDDRTVGAIPMSHSYGLTSVALHALVRAVPIVLPEDAMPFAALEAAAELGATVLPTAPAYLQALLKLSQPPKLPETLRLVISASAPLAPATAARFREVHGRAVHVFYGASECGGICYDREGGAAERATVGCPVDGVTVSLERWDGRSRLDEGIVTVRSDAVGQAYLPAADERLGGSTFTTNDAATWTAGELTLVGRTDAVVNIRGRKVNPSDVEAVLKDLPGVEDVAAVGVPSIAGHGDALRVVVACQRGALSAEDVVAWCRLRLSDHAVPRSVVLVRELPRTSRGKLSRQALLALEPSHEA